MNRAAFAVAIALSACATPIAKEHPVDTGIFAFDLPGAWERRPSDDAMIYTSGADTLYITASDLREPGNEKERQVLVSRIADLRRKLIGDLARGKATFSRMHGSSQSPKPLMYFTGEDPRNDKRFFVGVIGLTNVVVTTALYRPLSASADGFEGIGRPILNSVRESSRVSR